MISEIRKYNLSEESVVVYRSVDNAVQLEVQLADETVWLTQRQMSLLFETTPQNITVHIRNIYKEQELTQEATCKDFLQVQTEGGRDIQRLTKFYNLDVIISVGYRVKSKRGTQFRQWANHVLKNYLLRGYAITNRFERLEQRVAKTEAQIEYFVHTALPPHEGIFMDGQIYDAYDCVTRLIKSAQSSIVLIDNYVDESTITMMGSKNQGVNVDIYTTALSLTEVVRQAESKFNSQYGGLTLHQMANVHDRFLILDDQTIYLIGASLKDAGKKLFAFTQMNAGLINELKSKL